MTSRSPVHESTPAPRYQPTLAEARATAAAVHGDRPDPYAWLRDDGREDPEVRAHLAAENAACERWFAPLQPLVSRLQAELAARLAPELDGLPLYEHGWWYQTRYRRGAEHPCVVRWREGAPSETVLDVGALAGSHPAYTLGAWEVSPDSRWLAYTDDALGRHEYTLHLVDRTTGHVCPAPAPGLDADVAFLDDGTVLYIRQHPVTHLGYAVWAHRPGTDPSADEAVYAETDDAFTLALARSRSGRYVLLHLQSTVTSEVRVLRTDAPTLRFATTIPRQSGHEYDLEDDGDHFLVRTNDGAADFRLVRAPIASVADRVTWQSLLPARPGVVLDDARVFAFGYAVAERCNGLDRLRLVDREGGRERVFHANGAAATLWLDANEDPSLGYVRYATGSLAEPTSRYALDAATGTSRLLRQDPVGGDHCAADYVTERRWVRARDGVAVPVTLLRRFDTPRDGTAPLLLTGYGAYGVVMPAQFDAHVLPLVDRGMVYAIAHVRGGGDLGRAWADAGRLRDKHHTFDDFVDVRRALVACGDVDANRCCATGASAGGLLIGVVANEAPTEFCALVAHVPFVDVLTSMLDEDLPLTTLEYDEWGDPGCDEHYRSLRAYSPIDNVRAQVYPAIFVTAGLHDAQVPYWEAAKWVATLRQHQTGPAPIVLRIQMAAGHAGATGRYAALQEVALEQAFLLERIGLAGQGVSG